MFKEITIIDNVLKTPEDLINLSKKIEYYSSENNYISGIKIKSSQENFPKGKWKGYRSDSLHQIDHDIFTNVCEQVLGKLLQLNVSVSYYYDVTSYLHITHNNLLIDDAYWHRDKFCFMAGVIYLNKTPQPNSGTLFVNEDNSIYEVENKFNRLVFYNSSILHRPQNFFGDSLDSSRLTLTFFLNRLDISISSV